MASAQTEPRDGSRRAARSASHSMQMTHSLTRSLPHSLTLSLSHWEASEAAGAFGGVREGVLLTLLELGRVVVDVGERDLDLGGARQPPHVAAHVLGLDDHVVLLAGLAVHVGQGGADDTWQET